MRKLTFLSIFSILFGGGIYIAFRSSSIILFKWIDYMVLIDIVENLRIVTLPYKDHLPDWFLYSLPDGLWMFSYSCIVLVIWKRKITKYSLLWLFSLPVIAMFCEALQYYHYIKGTFDVIDIIFFIFGALLPILINKKMKNIFKSGVSLLFLSLFLVFAVGSSDEESSDKESSKGPEGVYYVGPSKDNSSYISFSPPNEHHSDYITWTGNKRNGNSNCATKGSYTYDKDSKTIKVSGFYNSNCGTISDRNGTWKVEGKGIVSPGGVRWRK